MRSGRWCLLFFLAAQAAIIIALRRFHSFADSKVFLLSSEAALSIITALWYMLAQPSRKKKTRPAEAPAVRPMQSQPAPQKETEYEQLLKTEAEEKNRLAGEVRTFEEREAFSKQRIENLEQEKKNLQAKLSETEQALLDIQKKGDSSHHIIQSLASEIERLLSQLESERRTHSIEIRTFLQKEEPPDVVQKKQAKAVPLRAAASPLPSLLLLLASCQRGLNAQLENSWPANEHRPLVRRKFFDMVQKMAATPLAVVSLDSPTEYYLSPKLPEGLDVNTIREAVLARRSLFESLKQFEPFCIVDGRMKGQYTAFRIASENLNDLVAMVPQ